MRLEQYRSLLYAVVEIVDLAVATEAKVLSDF